MNSTPPPPPDGSPAPSGDGPLSEAKTAIAQTARTAATQVKSAASTAVTRVKDEAGRVASEKKETAATRIDDYGSAIHETASQLEEKDPNIAWFTHQAADKLEGIAEYVRGTDLDSFRSDCARIARRHPAAFFGGLFVAGLVLGNAVKASRRRLPDRDDRTDGEGREDGEPELSADGSDHLTAAERATAGL
jgi:hypothetical protein